MSTVKSGMEALTVCAYETGTFHMETWASTEERNLAKARGKSILQW